MGRPAVSPRSSGCDREDRSGRLPPLLAASFRALCSSDTLAASRRLILKFESSYRIALVAVRTAPRMIHPRS
jgi:hypothetical protein